MIRGIGVDIIEIERIAAAIKRHNPGFLRRLFTERELAKCQSDSYNAIHFAGRFAAKEAVVKAFGTGFQGISWKDIEIINDELGKPLVILHENLAARFGHPQILLTISHSKHTACAFCIVM